VTGPPLGPQPAVRRILLGTLLLGLVGTELELLLLGHTEGAWQLLPLVLLGMGLAALAWLLASRGAAALAAFRATMGLLAASGAVGTFLHYRGNLEFELEMTPALSGLALFREAMTGATPALAPGALIVLGLVGLAYVTGRRPGPPSSPSTERGER
jgi:hypothetical protein